MDKLLLYPEAPPVEEPKERVVRYVRKGLKWAWNLIFGVVAAALVIYIIGMRFAPDTMKNITGYQTFVVRTDSMEPTIPVGSLVLDKNIEKGQEIRPGTIISFHVDRLGRDAVFTHYFVKKEVDETGRERYYTKAENADRYDDYKTYEEDLIGTYVLHIPRAGRFVLFLQSPFALLELGFLLIIYIVYSILWDKFDREEQLQKAAEQDAQQKEE